MASMRLLLQGLQNSIISLSAVADFREKGADHIGGTAGCVLASRLSDSPQVRVLVIERGQLADTFWSRAPLLSIAYARSDDGVLKYESAPQRHLNNRKMTMIAGKLLGGTSRVNNGLYSRCHPAEFLEWGRGWSFEEVSTFYDQSEHNISNPHKENPDGKWKTRIIPPFFESSKLYIFFLPWVWFNYRFLDTVTETGVPFVEDFNDPLMAASSITKLRTTVTADGHRSSTDKAFLSRKEVEGKKNLRICFGVIVQKLEIDENNRVQGVYVEEEKQLDTTFYIKAKEVILCSGAVGSPQMLLLRYLTCDSA